MKTILFLMLLTAVGTNTHTAITARSGQQTNAGHTLTVSLKYDPAYERYDVYAVANFTQKHFLLGPSQVSIIVPKSVANQSFDVYSSTARWTDYSTVYEPSVAPNMDFHGVNSLGKNIDVQQDAPFVLFSFSLRGGYVEGVRLFMNGKDPNSKQPGMNGGDFANTLQNHKSEEFFRSGFSQAELAQLTETADEPGAPSLSVYPNPVTGDAVQVTARQATAGERLKLRLFSATGVELMAIEEDAEKVVDYRLRIPRQLSGQAYLYVERPAGSTGPRVACKKIIILN